MTTKPIIIGMIGAGFAASFHVENYKRIPGLNVRIKGVTSKSKEKAAAFAETHDLEKVYDSHTAILSDPEIEIVDLCVPNYLHYPLSLKAAEAGKHIICEKPLTGYFGSGEAELIGHTTPRRQMFEDALRAADEVVDAVTRNGVTFCYGENWVYAPSVTKANDILAESDNTILRISGEESHSGSHSEYAKEWRYSGGGSLINKGCHPLGAALYLKYCEGVRKYGSPIKPKSVTAEVANLTHIKSFLAEDDKWVREGWKDCEDWSSMMITFSDDSIAQITASDMVLGGIQNIISVYSSKTVVHCNINPNTGMLTYAPSDDVMGDTYIREKVETRSGWQFTNPDEDWMNGFPHELQDFCDSISCGRQPKSTVELGRDIVAVCYGAYIAAETGKRFSLAEWM